MIGRDYCTMMARYNMWQNSQLSGFLEGLEPAELTKDRGAFFGSIQQTLGHLMWGDHIWISRFDGGDAPSGGIPDSAESIGTLDQWQENRAAMDQRILLWAKDVKSEFLQQDMTWFSGAMGCDVTRPVTMLVTQMFNHQTHHRGQVHAMLTAAGSKAPVSDVFFMPDAV
ncbi:MAG: DinB family protein [Rhodobacteraceae bacterium]|nr:DinB family protein [Paracoccaceae bacterium]